MFNRVVLDQNIFTVKKQSALPRILLVNTLLALMVGVIFWAVLERNFELEQQMFAEMEHAPQTISSAMPQPDSARLIMMN